MTRDEHRAKYEALYEQIRRWHAEGKRISEICELAGNLTKARIYQILCLKSQKT